MKIVKEKKGITLIALIITIVIMLILVGVSINIALDNGLFKTAQESSKKTQNEIEKENAISSGSASIDGNAPIDIEEYVNAQLGMVEIYDSEFIYPDNKLKIKAKIKEIIPDVEYTEYGFLATREVLLNQNENKDFTLDSSVVKISNAAYSKSEGLDKFWKKESNYKFFDLGLTGINESRYGENFVVRVYVKYQYKGQERIVYSNYFVTNANENIEAGKVVYN